HDKDGHRRDEIRIRWWDSSVKTYRDHAMLEETIRATIPDIPLGARSVLPACTVPTFFGHYWMTGQPRVLAGTVACVDFSAGKNGPLVAYRWSGERVLDDTHFMRSGESV